MTSPDGARGGLGVCGALRCALVLLGTLAFFTSLDLFAFEILSGPRPAYLVYGYCAAVAALVLLDPNRRTSLHRSPVVLWIGFFLLVTLLWGIGISTAPQAFQELIDRLRSIALLAACMIVFDEARASRLGVLAVSLAAVLVSLLNLAELVRLVEFPNVPNYPRVPGRASGFYGDSNAAGQSIALGLAVAIPALRKRWRVPLLVVGAAGIAATFSRSAAVCFVILFAWLLWRRALGAAQLALLSVAALVIVSVGIGYLQSHDFLTDNTAARLAGAADDSGRGYLATRAWEAFESSPWIGNGLGATNAWEKMAHNTFLTLAADHGVLGLIAFPALGLALAAGNRTAVGFSLVLMTAAMFSHTLIQGRTYVFLIALAAAAGRSAPAVETKCPSPQASAA
jgi:O-antigen ligase